MSANGKEGKRERLGYGSTYRKAKTGETAGKAIQTVLGGQAWLVRPDRKATASRPCLWMQSGAVKFKNCTNFYDCPSCDYDHAMAAKARAGKQISWQDALRLKPDMHRLCRHALTGRSLKRTCAVNYECARCDFDQLFEDVLTPRAGGPSSEVQRIRGFGVPRDHGFHEGHTWARIESGGALRIGQDDFALKLLGQADAFELPLMGKELDPGRIGWGMRRNGHHADVLSPVGGVIVEVNSRVRENAGLANREPYADGWLFMVRTPDPKAALKKLMTDQQSVSWMTEEVGRLESLVEEVAGPLAADGGYLADDIFGNLPGLGWERLTRTFLRT